MLLFSPPWESRLPLKLRRLLPKVDYIRPFWNEGAGEMSLATCLRATDGGWQSSLTRKSHGQSLGSAISSACTG